MKTAWQPARPQLARPAPAVSKGRAQGAACRRRGGRRRQDQERIDGVHATTLKGTYEELFAGFKTLVDDYIETNYRRT